MDEKAPHDGNSNDLSLEIEEKESEKPERAKNKAPSKRDWGSIPTAVAVTILVLVVSNMSTFFATKAELSKRIDSIESRLSGSEKADVHLRRGSVFSQINNLRILEDEIDNLNRFLVEWTAAEFVYDTKYPNDPESTPPATFEFVVGRKDGKPLPRAIDIWNFIIVVNSPEVRAMEDTELLATISRLVAELRRYNSSILDVSPNSQGGRPTFMTGVDQMPGIKVGLSKKGAEAFMRNEETSIVKLRTICVGLKERITKARRDVEKVLDL